MRSFVKQRHKSFRRSRAFAFVVGFALAGAAGALAFVVYALTVSGSGTGGFAAPSQVGVLSITQNGTPSALDVGQTVSMPLHVTNNDTSANHTIQTAGGTFTTKDSNGVDNSGTCASHLSLVATNLVNLQVLAGQTANTTVSIKADSTTPSSCASGTYSVTFNGTTN